MRERCVVLVGKSGAGKSTVANHIVGLGSLPPEESPFMISDDVLQTVTRDVRHEVVEFRRDNIVYRVTVIDTVGLFDANAERSSVEIFEEFEKYFKSYIKGVSVILFVMKKGRFTDEEQKVFSFIRSKFDEEISPISALVVTNCENDSDEKRSKLVLEFSANQEAKKIVSQMKMGIFPVGFVPYDNMGLEQIYRERMVQDRETLRDVIIGPEWPRLTEKLFLEKLKPEVATFCNIL